MGGKWASSPRAVCEAADTTFVMVTNTAALEGASQGPDGLLAGLGAGKLLIDMSTVGPATSRTLAAKVREKGADMLDAPVSGSISMVEQGKLSIMVGGHRATFDSAKPLLEDIGQKVTYIGENGAVTAFSGKVEIGQNNRTMFTQLVAEELRVPVSRVNVITGDTGRTPWDRGTVGSESAPILGTQFRRAGAAAREMIVARAARQWNVEASRLVVRDGRVSDPGSNRAATYAELLQGQELTEIIPKDIKPTAPAQWTIAGTSVPKVDGRAFVTGGHKYLSDMKLPGMVHGKMVRPPAVGATIDTVDASAAQAMPGVTVVRDGEFLGVTAPTLAAAERALAAMKVTWKEKPGQPSNAEIFDFITTSGPSSYRAAAAT